MQEARPVLDHSLSLCLMLVVPAFETPSPGRSPRAFYPSALSVLSEAHGKHVCFRERAGGLQSTRE